MSEFSQDGEVRPMSEQCPDPFHDGTSAGEQYDVSGPDGWIGTGYRCPTCGFQTLTVETYTPVEKPCPQCGRNFMGMDDYPDDLCDDCTSKNLAAYIAEARK